MATVTRLATPVQPTPPPIEEPWLAAVATITVIMVVIFCAAIVLAADPTNSSTRGSDEPSIPLSAAPTLFVGEAAAAGD